MSTDNVVEFPGFTTIDYPAEHLLQRAIREKVKEVVICGWDADGEPYVASSVANASEVLWLLERAKIKLFKAYEDLGGQ